MRKSLARAIKMLDFDSKVTSPPQSRPR